MGKKKNTERKRDVRQSPAKEGGPKESAVSLKRKKLYSNPLLYIILIALVAFIAYSNSFNAPFTFDDKIGIVDNDRIKDLGHQIEQLKKCPWSLSSRYIGYITFMINYKLHGFDVTGYHVFNFVIHLVSSFLVYLFVIYTFRTPFLNNSEIKEYAGPIAFFSGLLFAVHPIQTQAVTYIIQRFASLASFFYLLSVVMYIKWRLTHQDAAYKFRFKKALLYFLSLISAVLAMKTKEIAFTLPVVIALYEFLFFEGGIRKRLLNLLPIIMTMLLVPLSLVNFHNPAATAIGNIEKVTRLQTDISRWDYLFTQFRVIVTYLRLMIFPVNQNVDYDYPLYHSFFAPGVLLSFLLLFSIAALGVYLFVRYRSKSPHVRVISFGIFWFFITLSVESSIIPIVDVIFEHRMYLPSAGLFTAFTTGLYGFIYTKREKWKTVERKTVWVFSCLIIVLAGLTYARNEMWKDNIRLWEDNVRKAPLKSRPHYTLANAYLEKGFVDKAIESYETSIGMKPDDASYHYNLGNAYLQKQMIDKAIGQFQTATELNPRHAGAYNNLGNAYVMKGIVDKAVESYETSLKLKPDNTDATGNLGNIYLHQGLTDRAIERYQFVLQLKPNNPDAHFNLGIAYLKKQENKSALKEFQTALRLNPAMKEAEDYIHSISRTENKGSESRVIK